MTIADFLHKNLLLLIGCALIPVAPIAAAFILCRVERRGQVKRMHYMRHQQAK